MIPDYHVHWQFSGLKHCKLGNREAHLVDTGGVFQCDGSTPSQMPELLVLMTLSTTTTLRTKSASTQAHSGAISRAKFMTLNMMLPAMTPSLDLMTIARPRRLPTMLFRMAKPLPFADGEAARSSTSIASSVSGQEAIFTCVTHPHIACAPCGTPGQMLQTEQQDHISWYFLMWYSCWANRCHFLA